MRRFFRRRERSATREEALHKEQARREHGLREWARHRRGESLTFSGEGRDFVFDVVIPGGIAGTLGGALMAILYMCISAAFGAGFWTLPKLIADIYYRYTPIQDRGVFAVILGLLIHFAMSGALGTLFAMLLPRRGETMFAVVALALLYSLVIYAVMMFFVVDWAGPLMRHEVLHPAWILAHLAWGACLSTIPILRAGFTVIEKTPWPLRREARA